MSLVIWKIISKGTTHEAVLEGIELDSFLRIIEEDPDKGIITVIPL